MDFPYSHRSITRFFSKSCRVVFIGLPALSGVTATSKAANEPIDLAN
jgi:hypothetical protein